MHLTRAQLESLRGKSPEGMYQQIRQIVRDEFSSVRRDELKEALEDAVRAGYLDWRDIDKFEE